MPSAATLDTALRCLELAMRHHGVDVGAEWLAHEYAVGDEPASQALVLRIARDRGFKVRAARLRWHQVIDLDEAFPVLARLGNGNWVVLAGVKPDTGELVVVDPLAESLSFLFVARDRFEPVWSGEVILMKRRPPAGEPRPFGLGWFLGEAANQKAAFANVALAALVLHGLALVTPLFFQIVIDKVLVHNSYDTLVVLGVGVGLAILAESILQYLRSVLLIHATNKMDIRLSTRAFGHLFGLPLHFFETSSSGVVIKHMQQLEIIREFLTGKLFGAVLDSWGLFVFLPMLMFYDMAMAGVVLFFSAVVAVIVLVVMPLFRRELKALYAAEGQRQSLLVESIHGARTVKSLALEPKLNRRWGEASATAVAMRVRVARLSITAQSLIGFTEKMLTVAIVSIGALKVFDGHLTVGELIAIQMLAGRVSGPLVQLVALVNEFQQTALSVRMLGEIMNRRPEQDRASGLRPPLAGAIELEDVTFHYPGSRIPALDQVSLSIPAGAVVGVVGRSGSGKTTFLRLLQGLYQPDAGHIRFDGCDIREMDLAYLRTSVGVVLQESFVFRGSVRDNIAAGLPQASFTEIVLAAQLAGADGFIQQLPQGYDTLLEENAANLSGGQKQRLAIARTLLRKPRALIFDEATSALDPESEAIVQDNLGRMCAGRTAIIVSHRLSSLVQSDVIIVFDRGRILATGSHRQLLTDCAVYRHLWAEQNRHIDAAGVGDGGAGKPPGKPVAAPAAFP